MATAKEIFPQLLASVLTGKVYSGEKIDEALLKEIYYLAQSQDMLQMTLEALHQAGALPKDSPVTETLKKVQKETFYRYANMEHETKRIYTLFEENQIPYLPLKGAVIKNLYANPYFRTSCDIDILVHPEDCQRAMDCLQQAYHYEKLITKTNHDYPLMSPTGICLELHYTLLEDDLIPGEDEVLEQVWAYTEKENEYRYAMTKEMLLFFHIVHLAKHFVYSGVGIKGFVDLFVMQNAYSFDTEKLEKFFQKANLKTFYDTALALNRVWFMGQPHTPETAEMAQYVLSGGTFGSLENQAAIQQAKGVDKSEALKRQIFLSKEALAVPYPRLNRYPILLPYYQVKRWMKFWNKEKRKTFFETRKSIHSVTDEKIDRTQKLLQMLDLV